MRKEKVNAALQLQKTAVSACISLYGRINHSPSADEGPAPPLMIAVPALTGG